MSCVLKALLAFMFAIGRQGGKVLEKTQTVLFLLLTLAFCYASACKLHGKTVVIGGDQCCY